MFRIRNARVVSSDETRLVDILVRAGKIHSLERADSRIGNGKRDYDANGRLVLPGFIDCHAHLFSLAVQQEIVQLSGSRSVAEMREKIRSYLTQGTRKATVQGWVIGRGWDQDLFREKRFPTRHDLDKAVRLLPAIMTRVCGHVAVLNSLAIEKLSDWGILDQVGKDFLPLGSDGSPTGLVREAVLEACWRAIPKLGVKELESLFLKTQNRCLGYGLIGVHCILSEDWKKELLCIRHLDDEGKLILKVSILLPINALTYVESLRRRARYLLLKGRNFLVIGFKLYADGSLGARTAALEEPYSDDPRNRGVLNYSSQDIVRYAKRTKRLRMVLASHAIGDRAVEQVLSAYDRAGVASKDGFRIEHCSVLRERLLSRVQIATICIQPMFSRSDYWMKERIGKRGKRFAYPFRRLNRRTRLIGGSDAPVESIDPLSGIRAALENIDEPLSIKESVALYTQNAAIASPITKCCGSVSPGRSCDLVVLNRTSLGAIGQSKVVATFVNGTLASQELSI